MRSLILYAIPFFVVMLALEWWLVARDPRSAHRGYRAGDTCASLAMGIGNVAIVALSRGGTLYLWMLFYQWTPLDLGHGIWVYLLIIPCEDFIAYWYHRVHHEVRFFWAAHVVHHSSRHFNFSTALRQSWTTPLTGPMFWVPLALVGFHPVQIMWAQAVNLIFQYWVHTERIGRLGAVEWVLNTPSHHRVHHGRNPRYINRNYAGVFIVWDRLFGSFEPESEPVDYGLIENLDSYNPVRIAFHEWRDMLRDALTAPDLRAALGYLFQKPGWRPGRSIRAIGLRRSEHTSEDAREASRSPSAAVLRRTDDLDG